MATPNGSVATKKTREKFRLRKREKPHASGPDIEMIVGNQRVMVDVTVVNPLNLSAKRTKPGAIFNRVETDKEAKYGTAVAALGAKLLVAGITAQGALSATFERLVSQIAPDAAFFDARRAIVAATVAGSGAALRNAESQLGVGRVAVPAPDEEGADEEEDDGIADQIDEPAEPLPAWVAAMAAQPPAKWGTIVQEAIAAARAEVNPLMEEVETEQPETSAGTAELQAAPQAAATATVTLATMTNSGAEPIRGAATARQQKLPTREQLATQLEAVACAQRVNGTGVSGSSTGDNTNNERATAAAAPSTQHYGNGAARRQRAGRSPSTPQLHGDAQGTACNNSLLVGPTHRRSKSHRPSGDRFATRVEAPAWYEVGEHRYHR